MTPIRPSSPAALGVALLNGTRVNSSLVLTDAAQGTELTTVEASPVRSRAHFTRRSRGPRSGWIPQRLLHAASEQSARPAPSEPTGAVVTVNYHATVMGVRTPPVTLGDDLAQ